MQHIFIVNRAAGSGKVTEKAISDIRDHFEKHGGSYKIEFTKYKGDATDIALRYAKSGEKVRIYACGGDGTLNETVNGIAGHDNVELGVIPCGSGNDFVSSICGDERDVYFNIKAQVEGDSVEADLLYIEDGPYAINQISMGFDATVANNFVKFKNKSNVSGKLAYIISALYSLAGELTNEMTVELDGNALEKDRLVLTTAANGRFQGGGMLNVPDASPFNRKISVMMIKNVSRLKFLQLFPLYMKGKHVNYTDLVSIVECKNLKITASKPIPVTYDGEILMTESINISVIEGGVKIILPQFAMEKSDKKDILKRAATVKK